MNRETRIKNPFVHYGILLLIYGVGIITLLTHTVFHNIVHGEHKQVVIPYQYCKTIGKNTTITFTKQGFRPKNVTVKRCDKVTFLNTTNGLIDPAFGDHPIHTEYAGFTEKVLGPDQKNSFVAHTSGTFSVHEHLKDEFEGVLIIK